MSFGFSFSFFSLFLIIFLRYFILSLSFYLSLFLSLSLFFVSKTDRIMLYGGQDFKNISFMRQRSPFFLFLFLSFFLFSSLFFSSLSLSLFFEMKNYFEQSRLYFVGSDRNNTRFHILKVFFSFYYC